MSIKDLVNLGIAVEKDGYSESEKELMNFETKYGISSKEFYDNYYDSNFPETISCDEIADWIFYCNCFLSCGGELNKI